MHRAPSVSWDVRPAAWRFYLLALLVVCAGLVVSLYLVFQPWGIRAAALLLVFLGTALCATMAQRKAHAGMLRWDGEHWYWSCFDDQVVDHVTCVLDLQRLVLLRIQGTTGKVHWLWLQSLQMDSRWLAFRRAVISSQAGNGQHAPLPLR